METDTKIFLNDIIKSKFIFHFEVECINPTLEIGRGLKILYYSLTIIESPSLNGKKYRLVKQEIFTPEKIKGVIPDAFIDFLRHGCDINLNYDSYLDQLVIGFLFFGLEKKWAFSVEELNRHFVYDDALSAIADLLKQDRFSQFILEREPFDE